MFTAKIDKLFTFDISLHPNFERATPSQQSITISLPESQSKQVELYCDEPKNDNNNNLRVWPFPDGLATRSEAKKLALQNVSAEFDKLKIKIGQIITFLAPPDVSEKSKIHRNIAILLIGSADKRFLDSTKESYASNTGLAHARAEWVMGKLAKNPLLKELPMITLNSGPSLALVSVGNESEKLALDRAVQVCVLRENSL